MYSDYKYMLSLGIQRAIGIRCSLGDVFTAIRMQKLRDESDVQVTDVAYPIWAELKEMGKKRNENVG